ncbi:MAG: Crp/Fnr family transcriptional regulator [Bacteroidota bacterium]
MKIGSVITLLRNATTKHLKKGEILIPAGATGKDVFFIRKGLVRSYYWDNEKLEEITFQLYPEYNIIVNIHSVLFDEPSNFSYQAFEDTKVYKIDYNSMIDLTSNNPDLLEINRRYIGRNAMRQAFKRVESFVFMSPEERYLKYMKDYPNVVNRTPDKYIANVLGITPVSLSRIRNRLATKKK